MRGNRAIRTITGGISTRKDHFTKSLRNALGLDSPCGVKPADLSGPIGGPISGCYVIEAKFPNARHPCLNEGAPIQHCNRSLVPTHPVLLFLICPRYTRSPPPRKPDKGLLPSHPPRSPTAFPCSDSFPRICPCTMSFSLVEPGERPMCVGHRG